MNKRVLFLVVSILLVIVSCEVVSRSKETQASDGPDTLVHGGVSEQQPKIRDVNNPSGDEGDRGAGNNNVNEPAPTVPSPQPSQPITHYDSKKLDAEVIDEANKLGEDPKTYRKLVRTEADGTKIYRMVGLYIIVNPNGDEAYLPDEI